jgi:CheY-like chemotaxis protein
MSDAILLIQTDEVIRRHLTTLIVESGYSCFPVANLAAGLNELRRHPCRFVVFDRDLPGVCAADFALILRSACPGIRLLALDSTAESRGEPAADSPFDAVIPKPFVFEASSKSSVAKQAPSSPDPPSRPLPQPCPFGFPHGRIPLGAPLRSRCLGGDPSGSDIARSSALPEPPPPCIIPPDRCCVVPHAHDPPVPRTTNP